MTSLVVSTVALLVPAAFVLFLRYLTGRLSEARSLRQLAFGNASSEHQTAHTNKSP